ncbi:MAG TPA: hypothetical protein VEB86_10795 [Chryseosolibacter sp.]|nr:hypothetical protein [Chryseosolibacter sp.]
MKLPKVDFLILLVFPVIISACGGGVSKNENDAVSAAGGDSSRVFLEGMYATSTRVPYSEYSLDNIFDDDAGTYWSTVRGAGPDEGFVIYFPARIYVGQIELDAATGDGLATINRVAVYADGHRVGNFDLSERMPVDDNVSSLFIKIINTTQIKTENLSSEIMEDEISVERFDSTYSAGIAGMRLFNVGGEVEIIPPTMARGSVKASSVLKPVEAYSPAQLFDSRREFVWAEGSDGNGENETLTFKFDNDQEVTAIKIWNGYQRSAKHFESNARIRSFDFGLKNGPKVTYDISDTMEPVALTLAESLRGKEFELKIREVYPGKTYKDLVVSEILFLNGSRPMILADDQREEDVKEVMKQTKGSILELYMDKRLHNEAYFESFTSDRSLILRSNRTFVLYDHMQSSDDTKREDKEVVADGNWEIVEQSDSVAKVRIFGKLFNLSETLEYYKGNTTKEFVKIFQDNLHITRDRVKGEKFVDVFYNKLPAQL